MEQQIRFRRLAPGDELPASEYNRLTQQVEELSNCAVASPLTKKMTAGGWQLGIDGAPAVSSTGGPIVKVTSLTKTGSYYPAAIDSWSGPGEPATPGSWSDGTVCLFLPANGETPTLNNRYGACVLVTTDPATGLAVYAEDFAAGGGGGGSVATVGSFVMLGGNNTASAGNGAWSSFTYAKTLDFDTSYLNTGGFFPTTSIAPPNFPSNFNPANGSGYKVNLSPPWATFLIFNASAVFRIHVQASFATSGGTFRSASLNSSLGFTNGPGNMNIVNQVFNQGVQPFASVAGEMLLNVPRVTTFNAAFGVWNTSNPNIFSVTNPVSVNVILNHDAGSPISFGGYFTITRLADYAPPGPSGYDF